MALVYTGSHVCSTTRAGPDIQYMHTYTQVFYDPKAVTYEELLSVFWGRIDPTIVRLMVDCVLSRTSGGT